MNYRNRNLLIMLAVMSAPAVKGYKGPISDHFDGKRFYYGPPDHDFFAHVKWLWEMKTVKWPKWINDAKQPGPPKRVADSKIRITYINHSTVLLQLAHTNILTDPVYAKRAGPLTWLGAKRIRNPGIPFAELPKIDVVLISHNHYDHLCLHTLKRLKSRDNPMIVTGLGVNSLLKKKGFTKVVELDWWQDFELQNSNLRFIFTPAQHSSGRSLFDKNKTLWGGYIIRGESGSIYFAGDTGYGGFFHEIKRRFPNITLAVLPIGSYEKRYFMKRDHMNPEDAVKTHRLLNVQQSVGMHYATFLEHPEQAVDAHEKDLKAALIQYKVPLSDFIILKFGEGIAIGSYT